MQSADTQGIDELSEAARAIGLIPEIPGPDDDADLIVANPVVD